MRVRRRVRQKGGSGRATESSKATQKVGWEPGGCGVGREITLCIHITDTAVLRLGTQAGAEDWVGS